MPRDTLLGFIGSVVSTVVGAPERIVEQIQAYGEAGVEEVMVQWWTLDDVEGLQLLADQVLPYVAG